MDDRTREEVERDEVLKEFEAIIHDNSDINNMLPTRKRENILGKNFSCGRRHQPLPLLKEITHHPPTQVSSLIVASCHQTTKGRFTREICDSIGRATPFRMVICSYITCAFRRATCLNCVSVSQHRRRMSVKFDHLQFDRNNRRPGLANRSRVSAV